MLRGVVDGLDVDLANEGEPFAVGRPSGLGVVVVAGSDLGEGFRGNIKNVEMGAAAIEIADGVALELKAINNKGRWSFGFRGGRDGFVFILRSFEIFGLGIAEN